MPEHKNDWAVAATRISVKLIASGNVAWFALVAIVLSVIWRFSYSEIKDIFHDVFNSYFFVCLGYVLFAGTVLVSKFLIHFMSKQYEARIKELAVDRDNLLRQGGTDIQSSGQNDTLL